MPKKESDLSITQRVLLSYIKYRTNNNYKFFEGNDYIAKVLDLTPASAKVFVNTLIRKGYLYKEIDKKGRRILSLSGKPYQPLFEDMSNVDKKILKQEKDELLQDNQYLNEQLSASEIHCQQLLSNNTDLVLSNSELTKEIQELKSRCANLENKCAIMENEINALNLTNQAQQERITNLENIFFENGISASRLEEILKG